MDEPMSRYSPNPREKANLISKLFFHWSWPIINKGRKEDLAVDDFYELPSKDATENTVARLEETWQLELERHKKGKKADLRRAIARAHGKTYLLAGIISFIQNNFRVFQPIFFGQLITYFSPEPQISIGAAIGYGAGVIICAFAQGMLEPHIVATYAKCGIRWQSSTVGLIYRKSLRLSQKAFSEIKTGQILDLVSSDAETIFWIVWFLHMFWIGPYMSIIAFLAIYSELGLSTIPSIILVLILLPVLSFIGALIADLREKIMAHMDDRVGIITEMANAMRVIKMYCWEEPFGKMVEAIRTRELKYVWKSRVFTSILSELYVFNSRFLAAILIIVYVATNNVMTAAKVFPMLALFDILCESTLNLIPWGVLIWSAVGVSSKRITDFLLTEEHANKVTQMDDGKNAVMVNNMSASWTNNDMLHLKNIDFAVKKGELTCVVGPVGSGKTSFLMALAGELPFNKGSVSVAGKTVLTAQESWAFNATIKNNVLFGHDLDQKKYDKVVKAASLEKDIASFPHGDLTLVGEKGVTLSGGQKARLSLARALYYDADVYLLDDPLSAVDANVGRNIYDKCINGYLSDKTVILVTHQLQYLKSIENIVVLKEGAIAAFGSYEQLMESGIDFVEILKKEQEEENEKVKSESEGEGLQRQWSKRSSKRASRQVSTEPLPPKVTADTLAAEDTEVGQVSWRVYRDLLAAGGWGKVFFFFFFSALSQASLNMSDWWLSRWTSAVENRQYEASMPNRTNSTMAPLNNAGWVGIYLTLTVLIVVFGMIKALTWFWCALTASKGLHAEMYNNVIRSPIRFFDRNPTGRIINRFSSDINSIDSHLTEKFYETFQYVFLILGAILVIISINPFMIIALVPLATLLVVLRHIYISADRQTSRLESVARSPIFAHVNSSLEGVTSIRAYNRQERLVQDLHKHYNNFTRLCGRLELDSGEAGIVLGYTVPMMWFIENITRLSAELEIDMVAAERILQYTKLESEAPLELPSNKPPEKWPQNAQLSFKNVNFAYSEELPNVLHDINLTIHPGEKVGVVGRTGAGKSSLVQMLFRLSEVTSGEVLIDGVNVRDLGLHDLRSKISIIPQDPVLFSGTVRRNLDPFDLHKDTELWDALEQERLTKFYFGFSLVSQVRLKKVVEALEGQLEAAVTEQGTNFSSGQRQLVCLARAILRQNKILVMDEATANVDTQTDDVIQKSIRERFLDCTVITIAHRLNTVMDSDRILVLEEGKAVEFDSPYALTQRENGTFRKLVFKTDNADQLIQMARNAKEKCTITAL